MHHAYTCSRSRLVDVTLHEHPWQPSITPKKRDNFKQPHNIRPRAVAPVRTASTEDTRQSDSPEKWPYTPKGGSPCTRCINREHSPVRLTREWPHGHTHEIGSPCTRCINREHSPVRLTRKWSYGHTHENGSPMYAMHQQRRLTRPTHPRAAMQSHARER